MRWNASFRMYGHVDVLVAAILRKPPMKIWQGCFLADGEAHRAISMTTYGYGDDNLCFKSQSTFRASCAFRNRARRSCLTIPFSERCCFVLVRGHVARSQP